MSASPVLIGDSAGGWQAIEAISTLALAIISFVSIPILITQLWLSRLVHIEDVVERGRANLGQTRSVIRELTAKRALSQIVTSEDIQKVQMLAGNLEALLPAVNAQIRLQGVRRSAYSILVLLQDVEDLLNYSNYALEAANRRADKFRADYHEILRNFLASMNPTVEDSASIEIMIDLKEYESEAFWDLIEIIKIKDMVKNGATAQKIADYRKNYQNEKKSGNEKETFYKLGADRVNKETLDLWMNELGQIVYILRILFDKIKSIVVKYEMQSNANLKRRSVG